MYEFSVLITELLLLVNHCLWAAAATRAVSSVHWYDAVSCTVM